MPNLTYIYPCFIVDDINTSVAFYVNKLGFKVLFSGPGNDVFWAIVGRDDVSVFLKAVATDVHPVPNNKQHAWARWDAYIFVVNPDILFEEYRLKDISFHQTLKHDEDGLYGFEVADADDYVLFFGRPAM